MRYLMVAMLLACCMPARGAALAAHDTPACIIYTDIEPDLQREAVLRMTRIAEEYRRRLEGSGGMMRQKFELFLFAREEQFVAAGGKPGTMGNFNDKRVMIVMTPANAGSIWSFLQREGFRQYARDVLGPSLPLWASEGMGEYFSQAIFTGDGFVSGTIHPARLKHLKAAMQANETRPIELMMVLTADQWNANSSAHAEQAWSMVHFLVHAEEGKYRPAFGRYLTALSRGRTWRQAWEENFGADMLAFERKWKAWWQGLEDQPTVDLFLKANAATLTSFLARAAAQQQTFSTYEAFTEAALSNKLKCHPADWLPRVMLLQALEQTKLAGEWSLGEEGKQLLCKMDDKTTWVGTYTAQGGRVTSVTVLTQQELTAVATPHRDPDTRPTVKPNPPTNPTTRTVTTPKADPVKSALSLAKAYASAGRKDKARLVLQEALNAAPDSPYAVEAKAALEQLK